MKIPKCKNFTGYKPCLPGYNCLESGCKEDNPIGIKILIVNLDAMGDVLMTTAQLKGLKRKFPVSTIYWITLNNAVGLLENNPYIDKVMPYNFEAISILKSLKFDYVMNVDKSQRSCALTMELNSEYKLGFGLNEDGIIIPLNKGSEYNYLLGMDDELKFRLNKRTGEDYLAETFENDYHEDEYVFEFTSEEQNFIKEFKKEVGILDSDKVVGFNTGCSTLFPNKKMTIEQHIVLIERLLSYKQFKIILLGGPEDTERNKVIAVEFESAIINTPTNLGVRKGACFESLADVVITGDSFGMHLAIALKKYVIAWFGLSCWEEIELFDRGVKLFPAGLECAPCWQKKCPNNLECIQMIDLERIEKEVIHYFNVICNE